MNILQLIDNLNTGGAERMAVNISNVLSESQYNIVLCVSRKRGAFEAFVNNKVQLKFLNKKNRFDLVAFASLLKIIDKYNIQIIHAHSTSVYWAVGVKMFVPKIKIIWHDHFGGRLNDTVNNWFYKRMSGYINGVISVSRDLQLWAKENLIVNNENVKFIQNFPFISKPNTSLKSDIITIVYLANIRPEKDHLNLIKAINLLLQLNVELKLRIILAGKYFVQDEYYCKIFRAIQDYNLSEYINLIGEVVNVSDILCTSDIAVICSQFEGLPVSLLEYGLAGLPVVVTDVGQCAEVVENGKYGIIVPPNNPDALSNALMSLIQNKDLRKEIGAKFKEHVESQYGYKNFLAEYNKLISLIIK